MSFFKEAVDWAGSQSELSRRLGISRQAVSKWKGRLPEHHYESVRQMIADDWQHCARCEEFAPLYRDGLCGTCHEDMNG